MIDPVHSLAFSIQANPGVYAVLVGSGVSRAAKIPTGWDVTLDLIRKLATIHNEVCDPAPDHWYLGKFGKEANYSDLLDELAKTPAERQQLLRRYWEPNNRERDEGDKKPTAAHRSIAALAARGFIRVIVTTNFDRLTETALTDEGIVPTILSSPDQIQGALPLIHTECRVFKVHGDYLDTRMLNTLGELDQYPEDVDHLLDRIFDEFGLIRDYPLDTSGGGMLSLGAWRFSREPWPILVHGSAGPWERLCSLSWHQLRSSYAFTSSAGRMPR